MKINLNIKFWPVWGNIYKRCILISFIFFIVLLPKVVFSQDLIEAVNNEFYGDEHIKNPITSTSKLDFVTENIKPLSDTIKESKINHRQSKIYVHEAFIVDRNNSLQGAKIVITKKQVSEEIDLIEENLREELQQNPSSSKTENIISASTFSIADFPSTCNLTSRFQPKIKALGSSVTSVNTTNKTIVFRKKLIRDFPNYPFKNKFSLNQIYIDKTELSGIISRAPPTRG